MESVIVDEDTVHIGDDSAEENTNVVQNQRDEQSEQESSSNSVGSSRVDSLKSTAKLATNLIPAYLRGSKDHAEGEVPPASGKGLDSSVGKELRTSQCKTGDDRCRADEVLEESSHGGIITDVSIDGWSDEDRFLEEEATNDQAQSESHSTNVQGEEETTESGHPNVSMHSFASNIAESEILEEDSHTTIRPSRCLVDSPFVPSCLRRRPGSSSKRRKDSAATVTSIGARMSPFSESIDNVATAERPAAFEPPNDPVSGAPRDREVGSQLHGKDDDSVSTDHLIDSMRRTPRSFSVGTEDDASAVNFVGAHVSRFSESIDIAAIAERPDACETHIDSLSGALGDTEVESQLQNGDADFASKADSSNDLRKKNSEFRSGYDHGLQDHDSDVSSASTGEADDGVDLWKRRRSQPEERWEEVASSSGLEGKPSIPETRQRRGVYRMPGSDAEGEDHVGENPPQVLVQPAGFVMRTIEFQLNLIVHMLAVSIWLVNFTLSTLPHPVSKTVEVKSKVTSVTAGAANQVSEVFEYFGDEISQAGPAVSKLSKKTFWGCLGVAYVICMLALLLVPALYVDTIIVNSVVEKPLIIRQALDFDFTQPRPIALLPLFPAKEIERIKNLPLDEIAKTRAIPLGIQFYVTVVLTLPESDYNKNLGMFQVTAELLSVQDQVILRSSKPCRLRYRSFPIQLVNTLIYAVPNLIGLSVEAQTIDIRLLEALEKAIPTASVRISIEPKATFRDQDGVPEIYEAAVLLKSTLPWPRSLISSCKWLFFLWNGVCLFLFEVAIILCCCRQVLIPSFGRKSVDEEIVQGEVKDERATREAPRHMRSSRKGRVYFEDDKA